MARRSVSITHRKKPMKKKFKTLLLAAAAALTAVSLAACSGSNSSQTSQESSSASQISQVTIKTSTGDTEVPADPKKIVVLDYGAADTIRALGKEDSIVGLPTDSLPSYLKDLGDKKSITDVGNLKEVDLEKVASLEPDLIILSGRTEGQMEEFKKIAPTVYFETSSTDYWSSVKTNIQELAKVFGDDAVKTADQKIAEIDETVKKAQEANKDSQLTTLTVMLNEGNLAGVSPEGRFSFIYNSLGFKPTSLKIEEPQRGGGDKKGGDKSQDQKKDGAQASGEKQEGDQGGQGQQGQGGQGRRGGSHGSSLSFESISQVNPDIIFVVDRTLAIGGDDTKNSDILDNALLQETNAGKNKRIITLTPDLWYLSGGGLESTKLMFDEVAQYAGQ